MEKRNLKVGLNTAKEWYKSGNEVLKELALQVFTEEELTFNFAKLVNPILMRPVLHTFDHANRAAALEKLQILADYFNTYRNKGQRQLNINGYFLAGIENGEYKISKHDTVRYPGVVYFLERTDLVKSLTEFTDNELAALIS